MCLCLRGKWSVKSNLFGANVSYVYVFLSMSAICIHSKATECERPHVRFINGLAAHACLIPDIILVFGT
ncbi:hypothetical protein B0T17DRAFT_538553 [Bombardia bombarda]|uniref:Uncharacterized protein n=1 Tax=Bombardia bombarda TaxID=252184 RepID=A0AA40BVT5_9PEZI|nr:hypothetical protein B0T17DRAFT_538553 [Bombardia bombarda]